MLTRQISRSSSCDNPCVDLPVVGKGLVYGLLQGLNPNKSMGRVAICATALRGVADTVAKIAACGYLKVMEIRGHP